MTSESTNVVLCERCQAPCHVAAQRRPDAEMLRRSRVPKGICPNCAVTAFLKNTYPCNMLLHQSPHGAQMLLLPHIQEQFVAIMQAGKADMRPDEIVWATVVAQWDLPTPVRRSSRNPWLPTDAKPRATAERRDKRLQQVAQDLGFEVLKDERGVVVLRRKPS